jgi:hypothetical protein
MQAANLTDAASGLELVVVGGLLDDPQAAIATTHQLTASAAVRAWRDVSLGVPRMPYSGGPSWPAVLVGDG